MTVLATDLIPSFRRASGVIAPTHEIVHVVSVVVAAETREVVAVPELIAMVATELVRQYERYTAKTAKIMASNCLGGRVLRAPVYDANGHRDQFYKVAEVRELAKTWMDN